MCSARSIPSAFLSLALGPHPQRELTPMPRLGSPCPRLGMAAGAPFLPFLPSDTLPVCPSCRSRSSRRTKPPTSPTRSSRSLGRRDRRRRFGEHRRHGRDRAALHRSRDRARLAGIHRAEELRGVAREPRLDSVARRRRTRHAGARGRDQADAGRNSRRMPRTACRASPGISAAGSARPTGIPTTSCGSTIGGPREWTGRYVHEAVTVRGTVGQLARRAAALRLSRHRRSSRDDRSLHDLCRAADARERPPRQRLSARRPSAARVSAELHRSAAASATACPASSSRR